MRRLIALRCRLLSALASLVMATSPWAADVASSRPWLVGKDSPAHEDEMRTPLSGQTLVLENGRYRLSFDGVSGALLELTDKSDGWRVAARRPELARSFQLWAPMADRRFNPVMGERVKLASAERSADGRELTLVWRDLPSEYGGQLDVTLVGHVRLTDTGADFDGRVENHSSLTVENIAWPILSDIRGRRPDEKLEVLDFAYGQFLKSPVTPSFSIFANGLGYYGVNVPTILTGSHLLSGATGGLYVGDHFSQPEAILFMYLSKPGYEDSYDARLAPNRVGARPSRLELDVVHFPFAKAGKTKALGTVHLAPYQGGWQAGVDIRRQWRTTWFTPQPRPDWIDDINAWQQLQINSAEDDLRTSFAGLYPRAEQAAKHGVKAIQLVGWNAGGQDRGNPSHNPDPRLGGFDALKKAIGDIQGKLGIHIILFSKFVWADMTRPDYESRLRPHVAVDPYGIPYQNAGDEYQTPTQLAGINTRRFAVGDMLDPAWRELCAQEFRKVLDLGADGMLHDEASNHSPAIYSFAAGHGYDPPGLISAGDVLMVKRFEAMVAAQHRQKTFLFAAEAPNEIEQQYYPLSYIRIWADHQPVLRYLDPYLPIMVAVTGFDDREMINRALMYRYIIEYEPFNFKGDLDDFPLTVSYGEKVDALRKKYRAWLWDSEYRDVLGATVTQGGQPYTAYSVFVHPGTHKHTLVLVNDTTSARELLFSIDGATGPLLAASPESANAKRVTDRVEVPPRSAVVIMEQ